MKRFNLSHSIIVLIWLMLAACSSGKVAFEHGNYYEAVLTSVNRLRKNADHEKSMETLRQAYPLALSFYEDRAKTAIASTAQFKWGSVVESYTAINVMYNEIRRSPGALKVIPNPANYYAKLDEAKKNAAEEYYAAGITSMTFNTRDKAKEAYGYFTRSNELVPGYKDVIKMMEAALWAATLKVVVEPIPVTRNVSVSAEFFDDKISEYLHKNSINQYVRFFSRKEAQQLKLNPDHIVKLEFDEFTVGQVYLYEKEMRLENDSVLVGKYVTSSFTQGGTGSQPQGGGTQPQGGSGTQPQGGSGTQPQGGSTGSQNQGGSTGQNQTPTQDQNSGSQTPQDQNSNNTGSGTTPTGGQDQNNNSNSNNNSNNNSDNNSNNNSTNNSNNNSGQGNSGQNQNSGNTSAADSIAEKEQVTICHIPPGNESARHTLVISKSALNAHLAHGDKVGTCEDSKDKDKGKSSGNKTQPKSSDTKKGNGTQAWLPQTDLVYFASASNSLSWLDAVKDTAKIYTTVKATMYYSKKTTTSKGIVSFKIIDAKTGALLVTEKMPGEYTWVSEWATFNGDERALTKEQLALTKKREQVPPPHQDLFIEFTRPIYDQVILKIKNFYKTY